MMPYNSANGNHYRGAMGAESTFGAVRRLENAWEKKPSVGTKTALIPQDKY
jgi:hypothetical protein